MVDCNGAQCGYCTPGFICAMAGVAETFKSENKKLTEKNTKNYLTRNLCRCTGYKPIIDAMTSVDFSKVELLKDRYHNPSWLQEMKKIQQTSVEMVSGNRSLFLPSELKEAIAIKARDPEVRLVSGSTDIGVVINKGKLETPKAMALYHIEELNKISQDSTHMTVGACVTLTDFENYCEKHFPEMSRMLHIFASPQIKNQGTLVGNVVNASPIADTIPFLMVADAEVIIESSNGKRSVVLKNFYKGYKQLDLTADEIVIGIKIPLLKKRESLKLYKASMRKDLDISAVTFAGFMKLDGDKITEVRLAYGGVAATVVRLPTLEKDLTGQNFSQALFEQKAQEIGKLISPLSDLRASKEYRLLVAKNYLKKFARELLEEAKS
jgi:xanthine dehydrogenase small subunit